MQLFVSLERPRSRTDQGQNLRALASTLEELHMTGVLIVQHPKHLGVWACAGAVVAHSGLQPLIAVSPDHTHPVTACREATSLASLYGRPIGLNLIAGANTGDAKHSSADKYARFAEFVSIVTRLLRDGSVSHSGDAYQIEHASLGFAADAARKLVWTVVAGSSEAAEHVAAQCDVPRVTHWIPRVPPEPTWAIHVGIITRPVRADAWRHAHTLFPEVDGTAAKPDHHAAWMRGIAAAAEANPDPSYFAHPFTSDQRPYPYLVGSYEEVGSRLESLQAGGCRVLVLQRSGELDDLRHIARVAAMSTLSIGF
jgi:alkanesulfonate monooxygenase SsuD/methylene tetrahydromethanopterin reductase-like flavin-dependent oxidoreductase (luciferase family)